MSTTRTVSALALAIALGACSDAPTTAPSSTSNTLTAARHDGAAGNDGAEHDAHECAAH